MQVLSSLSSIPFYAPSAGHAPTNSADVSAIASAYQVVSSTATQLYAGTAYVTSVNDNPLSASRAGNAANASMANSAYYDGTGRLISALPDSATVSAIASSYAESAASSKQDKLTFGYNTADQISSIDGSALGGMDEAAVSAIASSYAESAASSKLDATASSQFLTAVPSNYATTAYVDSSISGFAYESAVSGWTAKQDTLTFGYDTSDKISSINGSSLAGEGGGTTYVSPSGTVWISGSSIEGTDSAYIPESAQQNYTAGYINVGPNIKSIGGGYTSLTISGGYWNAPIDVLDQFDTIVTSLPVDIGALYTVSGGTPPYKVSSEGWSTMYYSAFGDPTLIPAKCIKLAHASASSNYYTTANVSGFFNSASVAFNADNQISAIGGSALAGGGIKVSPSGTLWISGESAESTDSAFIPGVATETFVQSGGKFDIGTTQPLTVAGANKVTIQNAGWFDGTIYVSGNGTLVSSVAHAGQDWPQTFTAEAPISIGANGWFYVNNYSAFNVVTSPDQVVPLAHASALSGYALSSDVSATVDLVGTQSANWGGSALQLSAGLGVSLVKSGNILIASTDETVLWERATGTSGSYSGTFSEDCSNFDRLRFHFLTNDRAQFSQEMIPSIGYQMDVSVIHPTEASVVYFKAETVSASGTTFGTTNIREGVSNTITSNWTQVGTGTMKIYVTRVVGINRTAEA